MAPSPTKEIMIFQYHYKEVPLRKTMVNLSTVSTFIGGKLTNLCCVFFFRHILASLHFNENVQRKTQTTSEGEEYYKVTCPKFKLSEEVVREVAVPPSYGEFYVITIHRRVIRVEPRIYGDDTKEALDNTFTVRIWHLKNSMNGLMIISLKTEMLQGHNVPKLIL